MELKEAKKVVINLREWKDESLYNDRDKALITFDNRITELECQTDKFCKTIQHLQHEGNLYQKRVEELEAEIKQILNEFDAVETQRDELVKAGTARIDALDDLLVCFRLGRRPSEKLFDRLHESEMAWKKVKQPGVAGNKEE